MSATTTSTVRQQYEFLPYPHREPADEHKRLVLTATEDLAAVNHYCFAGRRNFDSGFRVLIAGGGTGDSTIYLAHQLRHADAAVVYLDLSSASLAVARRRAEARGLQNQITWLQGSLLDLPQLDLEPFDYVNCSGVLHHLADPAAGLAALKSVLKPEGAMGIMVYGKIGRTGVYQLQDLFRHLLDEGDGQQARLELGRTLFSAFPATNWYQRARELFPAGEQMNDAELYDMFLHSQDRAFTVPELYDWLAGCGLQLVEFAADTRIWYDPRFAFKDPDALARVRALPRVTQQAICELWWGSITKHMFWTSAVEDTVATIADPHAVPVFSHLADVVGVRESYLAQQSDVWKIDLQRPGIGVVQVRLNVDPITRRLFELADGRRPLRQIIARIAPDFPERAPEQIWREIAEAFEILRFHDLMLLTHETALGGQASSLPQRAHSKIVPT